MKIETYEKPLIGANYDAHCYVEFDDVYGNKWRVEDGFWHDDKEEYIRCFRTVRMVKNKKGIYRRLAFGGVPIMSINAIEMELEAKKLLLEK